MIGLAGILVEQGRYRDAEKLGRSALEVQRTLGISDDLPQSVMILSGLGNILVAQGRMKEAATVYDQLDRAVANWPAGRREALAQNSSRIAALYAAGQIDAGIAAAEALVSGRPRAPGRTVSIPLPHTARSRWVTRKQNVMPMRRASFG